MPFWGTRGGILSAAASVLVALALAEAPVVRAADEAAPPAGSTAQEASGSGIGSSASGGRDTSVFLQAPSGSIVRCGGAVEWARPTTRPMSRRHHRFAV